MSDLARPNFSRNPNPSTAPTSVPAEIQEQRSQRKELGAIWKRTSKTNNMEYMTIRLKLTKAKLQELLSSPVNEQEEVEVDLVAFVNKNQENNPKRPSYRIYPELS